MQYKESYDSEEKEPTSILPPGSLRPLPGDSSYEDLYSKGLQAEMQFHERKASQSEREITRNRILEKIGRQDFAGKEHFIQYIRFKYQKNCRPNTMDSAGTIISQFLTYLKKGTHLTELEYLSRCDIEGFFEQQQSRELKVRTLRTHMASVYAFVRFLVDEGIVGSELLFRKISIRPPESLRKDINSDDMERLLSVIEDRRDRAMVVLLLRTGMRISELLSIEMSDINLEEQTIRIYESMKTGVGRVVYFSNDAAAALYEWLLIRDYWKQRLFYGQRRQSIGYAAVRKRFVKYIERSGLTDKGYTLHCLRHTFATNLLNAGMPIEVLRDLLGHSNLAQTQHYAKLVDRVREAEFFKAMAIIEGEDTHESD